MPKECTTHYHACECREKMIRDVCRFIINFHTHLLKMASTLENNFVCECSCDICNKARILLDIPEIKSRPETKYDFTKFSYDCQYNVLPLEPETTEYCKRNDCECKEELCPLWGTYKETKTVTKKSKETEVVEESEITEVEEKEQNPLSESDKEEMRDAKKTKSGWN